MPSGGLMNLLRGRSGRARLGALDRQRRAVRREIDHPGSLSRGRTRLIDLAGMARSADTHAGLPPFDEQLQAALGLLEGYCVDMATGEGKTLAAILAAGVFVRQGRLVHILCPNDYLAGRDHRLATKVLAPLGISTGLVAESTDTAARQRAWTQQVVHSTIHEVAYDLMRDGLVTDLGDRVSPRLEVAIVDEVDAVLLDEATQPLVIARPAEEDPARLDRELRYAALVARLDPANEIDVDPVAMTVSLTTEGVSRVERELGIDSLVDADQVETITSVNLALHAHALLHRDIDYVVRDGRIALVSGTRGRVVERQRWPEGLQGAVEAKESLRHAERVEVMDQLTIQEVAKAYPTLIGMSGSATLAAEPLHDRYGLLTAQVPPRLPLARIDAPTRFFDDAGQRNDAVAKAVCAAHRSGRPVLVGTQSVAASEALADRLADEGIDVTVLNARNPDQEARIVARAGRSGQVTISTQMAGRGTDIVLDESARRAGGLLVIGVEHYPTERLDHQLRGRAGRQGDPGSTEIFASLSDPLFGEAPEGDGVPDDLTLPYLAVHRQRIAEGQMLAQHEQAWAFTRVPSEQRRIFLAARNGVLEEPGVATRELFRHLEADQQHRATVAFGDELDLASARVALAALDDAWSRHLGSLTELREGIHLRRLARLSPLAEFDSQARKEFTVLIRDAADRAARDLMTAVEDGIMPAPVLRDPGALWAYRVIGTNWGSPEDRFLNWVGERIRDAIRG